MELCLAQLKSITNGAIDVTEENGEYRFHRFTEKQTKEYGVKENLKIRCACPAGVSLDFETDSDFFQVQYSLKFSTGRPFFHFDFYVNDIFTASIGEDPLVNREGTVCYQFPKEFGKTKRVTIYLPQLYELTLSNISLSNGSRITPAQQKSKKLFCLGDSITQGMEAKYPSNTYPVQLARYLNAELLNQGVGGYIFNHESLDKDLPYSPDLITVAYGTNDWSSLPSAEALLTNVTAYFKTLCAIYPTVPIYAITPLWRSNLHDIRPAGTFEQVGNTMRTVCEKYPNIKVVDGMKLVPNMSLYLNDKTIHPNDLGFLHYAFQLSKAIATV
jgi:Lysophospholipase L1 and related esterases